MRSGLGRFADGGSESVGEGEAAVHRVRVPRGHPVLTDTTDTNSSLSDHHAHLPTDTRYHRETAPSYLAAPEEEV